MRVLFMLLLLIVGAPVVAQSEADRSSYEELRSRIAALKAAKASMYHVAKAQCWFDASWHEYTRNDRSKFPQEAREQAAQLADALEKRTTPSNETELIDGAERLRPELWSTLAALRCALGAACAAEKAACAEVKLVHAGHEYRQLGRRRARPYLEIAEDWVDEARQAAAKCR